MEFLKKMTGGGITSAVEPVCPEMASTSTENPLPHRDCQTEMMLACFDQILVQPNMASMLLKELLANLGALVEGE